MMFRVPLHQNDWTPLRIAAEGNKAEAVATLLAAGADPPSALEKVVVDLLFG